MLASELVGGSFKVYFVHNEIFFYIFWHGASPGWYGASPGWY